jgi:multidrug transporter EmrE-like cation transporter
LLLGVVNYGTIYFLLLSYDAEIFPRSTTLAINNIAVVLTNAFVSYLLFAERFSRLNLAGLVCALLGIGLLAVMR